MLEQQDQVVTDSAARMGGMKHQPHIAIVYISMNCYADRYTQYIIRLAAGLSLSSSLRRGEIYEES